MHSMFLLKKNNKHFKNFKNFSFEYVILISVTYISTQLRIKKIDLVTLNIENRLKRETNVLGKIALSASQKLKE